MAAIRICLGDMSFFRDVVGLGRLKKHFGFSDDLSSIYKALIFLIIPVTLTPPEAFGNRGLRVVFVAGRNAGIITAFVGEVV